MLSRIDEILERCSAGIGGTVLINGKYEDGIEVEKAKQQLLELIKQEKLNTLYNFKVDYMKQSLEPGGLDIMAYLEECLNQLKEVI